MPRHPVAKRQLELLALQADQQQQKPDLPASSRDEARRALQRLLIEVMEAERSDVEDGDEPDHR